MRLGGGSLPATAEVEMAATAGTGGEGGLDANATPSKICKKSSTHGMSNYDIMLQVSYYYHDNDDNYYMCIYIYIKMQAEQWHPFSNECRTLCPPRSHGALLSNEPIDPPRT